MIELLQLALLACAYVALVHPLARWLAGRSYRCGTRRHAGARVNQVVGTAAAGPATDVSSLTTRRDVCRIPAFWKGPSVTCAPFVCSADGQNMEPAACERVAGIVPNVAYKNLLTCEARSWRL